MAFNTTFEKFAKQQRQSNPDITDAEIEQLWSQQPLSKRISSKIESAIMAPVTIPKAIGSRVFSDYENWKQGTAPLSNTEPADPVNAALWKAAKNKQEKEQERLKSLPQPIVEEEKLLALPEMSEPTAGPKTLSESLQDKSTPEVKKEAKKAVAATDNKAKEAQKAADRGEIPQVEADRFKEERDRAYKMYSEAKDRNEWLELAQILGQAVTQYGAAQVGMRTGRPMAGLQLPSIDYGARTAQEQRLLESRLRDIGEEQTREQRLADRLKEEEREKERIGLERRRVELAEREARVPKEAPEAREIRREERKKQEQKQAAITNIMAGLATLKVGNKKQKEAASELIDKNIAEAGLPSEAINKLSELKEGPGFFSGSWDKKRQEVESLLQSETPPATIPSRAAPSLSTEDQQALEWATQNPNDPRAAEIRKRLGR